jgi:uncharacterized membrane protein
MNGYLFLKLIHIVAVIMFIGNITTGLFWMRQANKTGNFSIISFTMKGVIASDRWFTIPGVIIITAAGFSAAMQGGLPLLRTGWIFWSIVLFTLSGLIFSLKVVPLQKKILQFTENKPAEKFDLETYHRYLQQWETWGLLALLTPLGALAMMVLKLPVHSIFS